MQITKSDAIISLNLTESFNRYVLTYTADIPLRCTLTYTEEEMAYSAAYGARNLRRLIEKQLEDQAANLILDSYADPIRALHAVVRDDRIVVERA